MAECTLIMDSRRYLTCVPLISGRPRPETSFDSDIWQVKVRSDYVIISAENILRVFTCNELHGFRTPSPDGVLFQRPFTWSIANCSVSQLKPMPASWLWSPIRMASAISSSDRLLSSDRKSSSSQNVPIHSASGGYCFSGDEPCYRHIITTCRTRRQDAIGDVVPAPVIALRYGFQQGL